MIISKSEKTNTQYRFDENGILVAIEDEPVPAVGPGLPGYEEPVPAVGPGLPGYEEPVPAVGPGLPGYEEPVPAVGPGLPGYEEPVSAVESNYKFDENGVLISE